MMSKKSPQLRFEGFTDDWEERKLGELLKSAYQGINTAGDKVIYSEKGVEILQSKHITSGYITFDDTRFLDKKRYSEYFPKYVPKKHDILFANIGTIGPSTVVETNKEFLIAWNILKMTPNENVNSKFIELFLQILNEKHYYEKITTGNATKFVNKDAILNIELSISSFKEQQKIGSFFKQLDDIIDLHQRKLDLLKEQKKGYLQKMFPKNGAKVPELRFAGFADDWEERKLGEVATFLNGRAYKQDELLDSGKYKVLRVGNFYTNDSWYYSNMELGDKYYVDKGDLVYTWSATFGPHIWSGEKVIYHYHIWKVELSKFLDRNFTLQLLEADKARLLSSTNGSTMIHVTKGDMESKIVSIPNIDEQKQIGSFFKQLDNTITLHQRKLDLLKEQKKGFLQKMFV